MKIKSHLDFLKETQLIQVTLQKVSTLPAGWQGGIVYNTSDNKVYFYNNSSWIAINDTTGLINTIEAGAGISVTGTGASRKVTFDPDTTADGGLETTAGDTGKARVKALGIKTGHIDTKAVTNAKIADNAVRTIHVLNENITFSKIENLPTMTVFGNLSGAAASGNGITVKTSLDEVISANDSVATAKAIKDYVDNLVGGLGQLEGGWDASTNSNFPSGADKGDYWYITVDGTIHGIDFIEGDVIIASKNGAGAAIVADWIPLKTKRGQASTVKLGLVKLATQAEARAMSDTEKALTPSNLADVRASDAEAQGSSNDRFVTPQGLHNRTATTTRRGIAELATQAEVDTGTDTTRIVTPATLHVYVDAALGAYGKFAANIGNTTATSYTVTHGFGTRDVQIEVYDNDTYDSVIVDVARPGTDTVSVNFANPPGTNKYRVVIRK
jgi:predicted secreted protein